MVTNTSDIWRYFYFYQKDFQAWIAELEELMQQGSTPLNIKKAILDPKNIPMNLRADTSSEIVPPKI
jgi:hypothetical protein